MTRLFSLMLTLTLFGALLSACESDGGGTYDPNAQPTAAIEEDTGGSGVGLEDTTTSQNGNGNDNSVEVAPEEEPKCKKEAPMGADCNPYCQVDCPGGDHCSHNGITFDCMDSGSSPPGASCSTSVDCTEGGVCLSMGTPQSTCFRFCGSDEDCGTGYSCTLSTWLEVEPDSSGDFFTLCEESSGGPDPSCEPQCAGKECGPDGCGGECGAGCSNNEKCTNGQCVAEPGECVPDTCQSLGRECGNAEDGCGGYIDCGDCSGDEECDIFSGQCQCVASCVGKQCGDDGCGGSCGDCQGNEVCAGGQCQCTPDCAGKECGDNGCGGTCGACNDGETCTEEGDCASSGGNHPCDDYCGSAAPSGCHCDSACKEYGDCCSPTGSANSPSCAGSTCSTCQ